MEEKDTHSMEDHIKQRLKEYETAWPALQQEIVKLKDSLAGVKKYIDAYNHMALARKETGVLDDDTLVMHCRKLREKVEFVSKACDEANKHDREMIDKVLCLQSQISMGHSEVSRLLAEIGKLSKDKERLLKIIKTQRDAARKKRFDEWNNT